MTTIFFIILFLFVPLFALNLMRFSAINIRSVSIPSIFFLYYLVAAYSGILFMQLGCSKYCLYLELTNQELILKVFFYSSISLLLVCCGFLFCAQVLKIRHYHSIPVQYGISNLGLVLIFMLLGVSMIIIGTYIKKIPELPILAAIGSGSNQIAFLRSEATNAFVGKYHRFALIKDQLLPFLTFILFSYVLSKRSFFAWSSFFIAFSCTFVASIITAERAPLLFFVIGLFLTYFVTKNCDVKVKHLLVFSPFLLITLLAVWIVLGGMYGRSISDLSGAIADRIFGDIIPAYFYLEIFPDLHDFLYGSSFPNPAGIIPSYEPYPITIEVYRYMNPVLADIGILGSRPTAFWAEAYANFGLLGPIIISPLLGVFLYVINFFVSKIPATPVKSGLYVWLCLHFMQIASSPVSNYLVDLKFYFISIMAIFLLAIEGRGSLRLYKTQIYSSPVR